MIPNVVEWTTVNDCTEIKTAIWNKKTRRLIKIDIKFQLGDAKWKIITNNEVTYMQMLLLYITTELFIEATTKRPSIYIYCRLS